RKVASFQPLGFTAQATGSGWQVAEVTDAETGLLPGDLILTVQGREPATFQALDHELRDRAESSLVVLRGLEAPTITYVRPPVDVDFPFLILALVGAAYLLIGFYTLVKDGRGSGRLFFCWCLASAALYLFTQGPRFDEAGKMLYVGDMLARLVLPPLTLHLFLTFPRYLRRDGRFRRALPFLYLPAAFLLAVQADFIFQGGRWLSAGFAGADPATLLTLFDRIELVHLALFVLASIAVLTARLRRSRHWEEHRQLRWIALGVAGGYLPFLAIYAAPLVAGVRWSEMVTSAAVLPLALVPLTFAYAILRYKLWDIEVMVRDAISYTLTLLVGVIGFSLANLAIDRGVPADVPLLKNVLVFVAGLSIAGVLVPAKRGISTGLELLQYRGTFGKRRALAGIGRELLHERDLGRLCNRLLDAMEESVDLERANLLLVRGSMLTAVRPEAGLPPLPVASLGEAVWHEEVGRLGGVGLGEPTSLPAQRIYAAGYRYALPLTVQGVPVGLALAGWKLDQERLTSDDVSLLRQLLDQAALAIENARLVDQLRNQLDEVSRLQQYSERIIESSPAGIAVIDSDGRIASANQGFAQLVGHLREELPGVPLESVLPIRPIPEPGSGPLEVALCEVGD
ncbi:MAG TPA: PAS domain-containing protein, partial [Thermoanaerobaculia bacterium]|nr:PAS domain-containing protein [Thermoanaerobaculia bacterium]